MTPTREPSDLSRIANAVHTNHREYNVQGSSQVKRAIKTLFVPSESSITHRVDDNSFLAGRSRVQLGGCKYYWMRNHGAYRLSWHHKTITKLLMNGILSHRGRRRMRALPDIVDGRCQHLTAPSFDTLSANPRSMHDFMQTRTPELVETYGRALEWWCFAAEY